MMKLSSLILLFILIVTLHLDKIRMQNPTKVLLSIRSPLAYI